MSEAARELLDAALKRLSSAERAELASELVVSLDSESSIEGAWATEVKRRLAEMDAGRGSSLPWSDVKRDIQAHLRRVRRG